MKLGNREIKLFYSNLAARDLEELCGGIKNISTFISGEPDKPASITEQLANVAKIIRILANAEITRHNAEISLGVIDGEKLEKYDDETFEMLLDASKAAEYLYEVLEVMGLASKFEIPEGVKLGETDVDLEEIEAEKNP